MQNPLIFLKAKALAYRNRALRKQKQLIYKRNLLHFNQIRTIGIISTCSESLAELTYQLEKMGKKVAVLLLDETQQRSETQNLSYQAVRFDGSVDTTKIEEFINYPFDILYCLNEQSYSPLQEYLLLKSPARCRIGRYQLGKEYLGEILIATTEKPLDLARHGLTFLQNQEVRAEVCV
ncbi:DUF6913 domain-containing protein [Hugenholtzia roseola]|uniref:DUF6913 domain-containing protein n=1 Tax=Hugenholtzia roseola TaxID=1002 RepID=UPI00041153BF|nr:hypothetical protein [Hugenholtzia roseola]